MQHWVLTYSFEHCICTINKATSVEANCPCNCCTYKQDMQPQRLILQSAADFFTASKALMPPSLATLICHSVVLPHTSRLWQKRNANITKHTTFKFLVRTYGLHWCVCVYVWEFLPDCATEPIQLRYRSSAQDSRYKMPSVPGKLAHTHIYNSTAPCGSQVVMLSIFMVQVAKNGHAAHAWYMCTSCPHHSHTPNTSACIT